VIGEYVGSYRIVSRLGKGGMGEVFVAEHVMLGNKAVVKMLLRELSDDQAVIDRFFNEAKAATQVKHPGIIQIFDFGLHASGSAFIVMELLDGETLARRIQRGRLAPINAAVIARQVASAVDAAHKSGIIHRDLKPDNLFLVPDPEVSEGERVKVLDFGIAKLASQSTHSTATGQLFGTPFYMSPEQCKNTASVDARTDVYALGCILYEMLTGRRPFAGETITELVTAHLFEKPKPPSEIVANLPTGLEQTILRALAKSPDDRQPSMAALAAELGKITGRTPTPLPISIKSEPPVSAPVSLLAKTLAETTLGRSTGQISDAPAHHPRRALAVGFAALAVVGAVIATIAVASSHTTSAPTERLPTNPTASAPPAMPAEKSVAAPARVPVPAAALVIDAGIDVAAPPSGGAVGQAPVPAVDASGSAIVHAPADAGVVVSKHPPAKTTQRPSQLPKHLDKPREESHAPPSESGSSSPRFDRGN
jgi:serine/threonine-protein kinase